jgi:hypothetical protein
MVCIDENQLIIINPTKTEQDYESDMNYLQNEFKNAQFEVCIDPCELDDIVSELPQIVLKNQYNCYCYTDQRRPDDYFVMRSNNLTYRYIIQQLIDRNFAPNCNHKFLEGFCKSTNPDSIEYQFMMCS